jgi:hypothetical protein
MDSVLNAANVFAFTSVLLPFWLVMLWLGFGAFVWCMREIVVRYSLLLLSLFGGLGGAMSYFAGYRLGAVEWPMGVEQTVIIVFVCWFAFTAGIAYSVKRNQPITAM